MSQNTLKDEILSRLVKETFFTLTELLFLINCCLSGMAYLNKMGYTHENLTVVAI